MIKKRRIDKRRMLFAVCIGWCLLTATTPGAIGSCGGDDDDTRLADFTSYCEQREELVCVRRYLRKEITAETRDDCRWDGVDACARRSFPVDCQPVRRETEACLRALASFDTLETPESELEECSTDALCKATPSDQSDQVAPDDEARGANDGATSP